MLPPDQQRDPNVLTRYREYLKARGFGDGDAEAQLKLVREQAPVLKSNAGTAS
jgi:hypothetical protein